MALCIQSLTLTPLNDDPTKVNGKELTAMYRSIESAIVIQKAINELSTNKLTYCMGVTDCVLRYAIL